MSDDHLTDEVLSAVLDGEATPAEARHVSDCDVCRDRLAELQRAASVIGSPVPRPDPARREAVIAAAMAARVAPLRSRPRPPSWVLGAAAAVVVLLALAPLVLSRSSDRDDAASGAADKTLEASAPEAAATLEAAGPVVLGDLGEVNGGTLAERVRSGLAAPAVAGRATGPVGDTADDGGTGGGATSSFDVHADCAQQLAQGNPDFGVLRGTGEARVGDRNAIVLAFASDDGRILVFAVAAGACDEVLLSVTFPAP